MGLTADRLSKLGLVDEIIREPLGGAHRDATAMSESLREALLRNLRELEAIPIDKVVATRAARLQAFGVFAGA
jgi:acetyl-CoA carboxylase carboxyl transferase subunit alpha